MVRLPEKQRTRIRSMDADVAIGAVLITRIGHVVSLRQGRHASSRPAECSRAVVALQTKGEHYRTTQQPRVGGPVRHVTHLAAFHADRRMLEGEGAALVCVTADASFFIG